MTQENLGNKVELCHKCAHTKKVKVASSLSSMLAKMKPAFRSQFIALLRLWNFTCVVKCDGAQAETFAVRLCHSNHYNNVTSIALKRYARYVRIKRASSAVKANTRDIFRVMGERDGLLQEGSDRKRQRQQRTQLLVSQGIKDKQRDTTMINLN